MRARLTRAGGLLHFCGVPPSARIVHHVSSPCSALDDAGLRRPKNALMCLVSGQSRFVACRTAVRGRSPPFAAVRRRWPPFAAGLYAPT
eukprot:5603170-Prymnesium_polylepis.1